MSKSAANILVLAMSVTSFLALSMDGYEGGQFLEQQYHNHLDIEQYGDCPICYEEYDPETLIRTPCQHIFHQECLDLWTENNNTCPYCRDIFPEDFLNQNPNPLPVDPIPLVLAGAQLPQPIAFLPAGGIPPQH